MFGLLIFGHLPFTAFTFTESDYDIIWRDSCSSSVTWTNIEPDSVTNLRCENGR